MRLSSRYLLILIGLLVVGFGGWYFFSQESVMQDNIQVAEERLPEDGADMDDPAVDSRTQNEEVLEDLNPTTAEGDVSGDGSYVIYSPEAYERAAQSRRVLFFYASWCPTCRPADAEFEAQEYRLPDDVTVLRVNYDTEDELKSRYNVTYQHTFVQVDTDDAQVTSWNGGAMDELLVNIE